MVSIDWETQSWNVILKIPKYNSWKLTKNNEIFSSANIVAENRITFKLTKPGVTRPDLQNYWQIKKYSLNTPTTLAVHINLVDST